MGDHNSLKTFIAQAELERARVQEVQASVEARYHDGRPLHHLPSARQLQFDRNASAFFVVPYEDYLKLTPSQVQDIFCHRHILVYDVPTEDMEFDRDGLSSMGSLTQSMDVQGQFNILSRSPLSIVLLIVGSLRMASNGGSDMLRSATLQSLYQASQAEGDQHVLNALDLPMGHLTSLVPPPRYRCVTSLSPTWNYKLTLSYVPAIWPPMSVLSSKLVSSLVCVSCPRCLTLPFGVLQLWRAPQLGLMWTTMDLALSLW
jgi:hypothetical protein